MAIGFHLPPLFHCLNKTPPLPPSPLSRPRVGRLHQCLYLPFLFSLSSYLRRLSPFPSASEARNAGPCVRYAEGGKGEGESRKMHVHPCRMFFSGPSSFMVVAAAQVVVGLQRKVALLKTGLNFSGMATRFSFSEKIISLWRLAWF